ncbi:MAG: phosphoglycerate mutase family protein [Vicinamibacteria bacterium]
MARAIRRFLRFPLAAAAVLAAVPVSAQVTTVLVVRHAEKMTVGGSDPHLSRAGKLRAEDLAHVAGASGVTAIYATNFLRTQETVAPLAAALNLTPIVMNANLTEQLVEEIQNSRRGQTVLVCGHSDTVPAIVEGLSGVAIEPIPDTRYDGLYVVTFKDDESGRATRVRYGKPTP